MSAAENILKLKKTGSKEILQKYGIVFVLILMVIGISVLEPAFLSSSNIFNVLTQSAIFGIMALGLTFVIISKGIDLSVGSILAFAGVVAASLAQTAEATGKYYPNLAEMPVLVPILAALGVGAACGAVTGILIAKTNIPAFISSLGMMTVARGFALIYSDGKPVSTLIPSMTRLGGKLWGFLPIPVLIYFVMIIISSVLLNKQDSVRAFMRSAVISRLPRYPVLM